MTYCVAWRVADCICIAADSAITSDSPPLTSHSSFGELHGPAEAVSPGQFVCERKWKLEVWDGIVYAFAGGLGQGRELIHSVRLQIAGGQPPGDALRDAVAGYESPPQVSLLMVFSGVRQAELLAYNVGGSGAVQADLDIAHIGSLPEDYHKVVEYPIKLCLQAGWSHRRSLAVVLAVLQSLGLHQYLVPLGVCGGFSGITVAPHGIVEQPDMLYAITDSQLASLAMVGSIVRDGAWVLPSTACKYNVAFLRDADQDGGLAEDQFEPTVDRILQIYDSGAFDFVAVLAVREHVVTVVEMDRHREHHLLCIEPAPHKETAIGVFWSPGLTEQISKIELPHGYDGPPPDFTVRLYPYHVPRKRFTDAELEDIRSGPNAKDFDRVDVPKTLG